MPQTAAPNIGINYGWNARESGWKAGMDFNLKALDLLAQATVLDKDLNTPPGSPSEGHGYIIGPAPTGAWASKAGQIAHYIGGAWQYYVPREGWRTWVQDEDVAYTYNGSAWVRQSIPTPINNQTGAYTLVLADAGALVRYNSGSGANITVPLNSTTAFPIGTVIRVRQVGAGAATVNPTGGVTLNGTAVTAGQNREIWITKVATDTWDCLSI